MYTINFFIIFLVNMGELLAGSLDIGVNIIRLRDLSFGSDDKEITADDFKEVDLVIIDSSVIVNYT
ncbi:MAG: hypothetical protein GY817_04885 [bacterium]|nr:hypothetical protein [bacterium]